MARDLLSRYIWIVDTIRRYRRISFEQIRERWSMSQFSSHGETIPRRTFYNYRRAIEDVFGIEIRYNSSTFEYYIEESDEPRRGATITDWLLNSAATSSVVSESRQISSRIFLEDIPSAREHLNIVIDAVKHNHPVQFDYAPYTRVNPSRDVVVEPYFLNLLRQRWYMTGRNTADGKIKTYALDRIVKASMLPETFEIPADFDATTYSSDSFGVIFSMGKPHDIRLRVDSRRARYLRTLPLHHSQDEYIHDGFSVFTYRLRLTPDLVSEIISMGGDVTVEAPDELRAMVKDQLRKALANYE
ncbi:MAG: WYL domain-containing protein [Muribaculaceae bacterium]|nr:WYL domain-containing protein [Muribaculaceae bacterium]MDE6502928.1 WYL domain-containing protein [Muribaculaceae bacterium]MDE6609207.1 WYL domain-containing protein [Muribaculaceae bacterium]